MFPENDLLRLLEHLHAFGALQHVLLRVEKLLVYLRIGEKLLLDPRPAPTNVRHDDGNLLQLLLLVFLHVVSVHLKLTRSHNLVADQTNQSSLLVAEVLRQNLVADDVDVDLAEVVPSTLFCPNPRASGHPRTPTKVLIFPTISEGLDVNDALLPDDPSCDPDFHAVTG